jgi:trk system potassium uptake protein TrkA
MNLVILGCGRVGSMLAALMAGQGHEVTVIDTNPDAFRRLPADFQGRTVVGTGIDEETLRRAGIERADGFVAVTNGDNRNIMATQMARHLFKVPKVIARIYDPIRAEAYQELGIETLCSTAVGAGVFQDYLLGRPFRSVSEYMGLCEIISRSVPHEHGG